MGLNKSGRRAFRKLGRLLVAGVVSLSLVLGLSAPAHADSEISGNGSQFGWVGTKSVPFCYIDYSEGLCDSATIGEINFNVRMTLNGRHVDVETSWQLTSGDHRVQVFSWVECRDDRFTDRSCGFAGERGYEDFATYGSFVDGFDLAAGSDRKYFFNLHYRINVLGDRTSPSGDMIETFLGTSRRVKCSPKLDPWFCQMAYEGYRP